MPSAQRRLLVLLLALVAAVMLPVPAAGAAAAQPRLELGAYNPAFVEALHDPLVRLGLGRLPSPVEISMSATAEPGTGKTAKAAKVAFPPAYSLIDQGRVTSPARDQDRFETCWAFANIAALESTILTAGGEALDLSEDNLIRRSGFWPSNQYRYYWGGYDFMAIAYLARWAGPLLEECDPYAGSSATDRAAAPTGPVVKHVQSVVMVPGRASHLDNALIKRLVTKYGGVSVGMWMSSYAPYWREQTSAYYYPSTPIGENHGVVVVGWDDAYPRANFGRTPAGDGAFLVRNTWGADWGDDGYFWVSYYDRGFARRLGLGTYGGCTSYAVVQDADNYSRNYGHDKLGVTDRLGYRGKKSIWAANRFVARSNRPITAAGFYTLSSGTSWEVWAGASLKTLKLRRNGKRELPGYFTVKFKTPLAVKNGRTFYVVLKLTSPDGRPPLAIERRVALQTGSGRVVFANASAARGTSYVGPQRWSLTDLTKKKGFATANVCLKAFAR